MALIYSSLSLLTHFNCFLRLRCRTPEDQDIPVLLHHTGGTIDLSQDPGLCPGAGQGAMIQVRLKILEIIFMSQAYHLESQREILKSISQLRER